MIIESKSDRYAYVSRYVEHNKGYKLLIANEVKNEKLERLTHRIRACLQVFLVDNDLKKQLINMDNDNKFKNHDLKKQLINMDNEISLPLTTLTLSFTNVCYILRGQTTHIGCEVINTEITLILSDFLDRQNIITKMDSDICWGL